MIQNRVTSFKHLGELDYNLAWDYQERVFKQLVDAKIHNRKLPEEERVPNENHLLFVYHPHVYTLGKSGDEKNLLISEAEMDARGISFYRINRGGDITYHGPGQIVGYPLLDLDNFFTDIHKYLRLLEESVILTLGEYNIPAGRIEGLTGVWLDPDDEANARKICALGVKASRWVTMHGFAFNINTDLSYFDHIIPCGIDDKNVTSMQKELGRQVDISEVEAHLRRHLADVFEMDLIIENE